MAPTIRKPLQAAAALVGLGLAGAAVVPRYAGAAAVGTAAVQATAAVGTAAAQATAAPRHAAAATGPAAPRTTAHAQAHRLVKPSGPISYTTKTLKFNARTQQALLTEVVITQGDLKVTADRAEATGLSFRNSRWTFMGNVHISSPLEGSIESDKATVEFRDGKMQDAIATGSPAQFEQTSSTTGVLARGHADSIVYTVALETVRLSGNAWLDYGGNKISSPELTYDIGTQQLQGASAAGQEGRVHITIQPKTKTAQPKAKPKAKSKAQAEAKAKANEDMKANVKGRVP